jgi:hypothetical protein
MGGRGGLAALRVLTVGPGRGWMMGYNLITGEWLIANMCGCVCGGGWRAGS